MISATVIGNLGRTPEIKYLDSGACVTSFTMASRAPGKKENGEENDAVWVKCNAWGKIGELIAEYCKKGSKLAVSGGLRVETWTDKEGATRFQLVCEVRDMELLTPKEKEADAGKAPF